MRTKPILGLILLFFTAPNADTFKNSISLVVGLNDELDFKYERRFDNFGIGINPGLLSFTHLLVENKFSGNPAFSLVEYDPAVYFSDYIPVSENIGFKPEVRFGYHYFKDFDEKDYGYIASPRLNIVYSAGDFVFGLYPALNFQYSMKTDKYEGFTSTFPSEVRLGLAGGVYAGVAF